MEYIESVSDLVRYRGSLNGDVAVFRGIEYGHYERLKEAHITEYTNSQKVIDAIDYGTLCPQHSPRLDEVLGKIKGLKVAEGSLCISIYAPTQLEGKHPVMVWIHGGSFLRGGSEDPRYGAERLVRTGSVVVVKISYRLGALGYSYCPEKGISNLGLCDQHLALRWISEHISEFGGDPDNVTLFGQSAGAHSIASIISTTEGTPLFNRAILASPPLGIKLSPKRAARNFARLNEILGNAGKDMESASMEEILSAQDIICKGAGTLEFMPVLDSEMHMSEAARRKGIKVVAGYAAQDAAPFISSLLGHMEGTVIGNLAVWLVTRRLFSKDTKKYISRLKNDGQDATLYKMSWYPKGNVMKSCHCIELPFLLGDYDDWKDARMLQGMTRDEYSRNSAIVLKAWTDFANGKQFELKGI